MLVLREAQLRAMHKAMADRQLDRLMEHAWRHFPDVAAQLGTELREVVARAVQRARSYGFSRQRETCKYLNLELRFGRDFDSDPGCAWAHTLLASALPGPAKMERLYRAALEHESQARGYFASAGGSGE
jgi:hypothetical protein